MSKIGVLEFFKKNGFKVFKNKDVIILQGVWICIYFKAIYLGFFKCIISFPTSPKNCKKIVILSDASLDTFQTTENNFQIDVFKSENPILRSQQIHFFACAPIVPFLAWTLFVFFA